MIKLIFKYILRTNTLFKNMKTITKTLVNKGKLLISQPLINDEFFHNVKVLKIRNKKREA